MFGCWLEKSCKSKHTIAESIWLSETRNCLHLIHIPIISFSQCAQRSCTKILLSAQTTRAGPIPHHSDLVLGNRISALQKDTWSTGHLRREFPQCFKIGTYVSFLSRRPGPNPAEKCSYQALSQSSGQMFRHCNLWQLHPHPHWFPHQKIKALPSTTAKNPMAKGFTSLPDKKWCLRTSCLWTLLQLSRAELPATLCHRPPTAAFSQDECWNNTGGCYPGTLPQHSQEDSHWLESLKKGTLGSQCSGEAIGTTSPHRDNLLVARKDLMSLSSLFPYPLLLVNILCS